MKVAFSVCLALWCSFATAQRFTDADFSNHRSEFISEQTLAPGGVVIEIYARNRSAMMQLLHRLHRTDKWEYEVSWGASDPVTVWIPAMQSQPSDDPRRTVRLAYRRLLSSIDMTYKVEGGLYYPLFRYRKLFVPFKVLGSHGAMDFESGEVNSLDVLAAALALQGVGYRVVRAAGSEVSLRAQNCPLSMLVEVLEALDAGIVIDQTLGFVVRPRGLS